MQEIVRRLVFELSEFLLAENKREYAIIHCESLFDELFEPVDLPGPDSIIDPLLRTAIRPLVGRVYDEILSKVVQEDQCDTKNS